MEQLFILATSFYRNDRYSPYETGKMCKCANCKIFLMKEKSLGQ